MKDLWQILPGNVLTKSGFMVLYGTYVLTMWTWRQKKTTLGFLLSIPMTLIGGIIDAFTNLVWASWAFRDGPKELMVTQRLKRYRKTEEKSWRGILAAKICDTYLDHHDPDGDHC